MSSELKILTFYLPQFHPIPENDEWWGKGFTEWTNTAKAKPLFPGHYQPNIPADLGFYDLRVPETRIAQANLARDYGIDGFVYWHYWFGHGKQLLERPIKDVLTSGEPDFPLCLAWANQSWTGIWHGLKNKTLIEQQFPGEEDYLNHFQCVLPLFMDKRYIKINKKPLFLVFSVEGFTDCKFFVELWNEQAKKHGFDGIYFIGVMMQGSNYKQFGFDAKITHQPLQAIENYNHPLYRRPAHIFKKWLHGFLPYTISYDKMIKSNDFQKMEYQDFLPTVIPNWDNTPRSRRKGIILQGSTPDLFRKHLESAIQFSLNQGENEKIVFIKSWNEWAEGNYLEPDLRWGRSYLDVVKEIVGKYKGL